LIAARPAVGSLNRVWKLQRKTAEFHANNVTDFQKIPAAKKCPIFKKFADKPNLGVRQTDFHGFHQALSLCNAYTWHMHLW
jgi:hypothetical protein